MSKIQKNNKNLNLETQILIEKKFVQFRGEHFLNSRGNFQQELKNNPNLLNNPIFVKKSCYYLNLDFKDYPESIKNNDYFIGHYFSVKPVSSKEYSFIPPELLKNEFFISSILRYNPDIYLLADKSVQNNFMLSELMIDHPSFFIKYASEEQINDIAFVNSVIYKERNNYKFLPQHIKSNNEVILQTFFKNLPSSLNTSDDLFSHVPQVVKEDEKLIQKLLSVNPQIFPHLTSKYYNNIEFCAEAILKEPLYFEFVSDKIKNNQEFVHFIMDVPNSNKTMHFNNKPLQISQTTRFNFKSQKILPLLPEMYFTNEFCNKHHKALASQFITLPKNLRKNEFVIKNVFKTYFDDSSNKITYHTDMFQTNFFNAIVDPLIKDSLKTIYKEKKNPFKSPDYIAIVKEFEQFIESYYLYIKIEEQAPQKTIINNKKKI